MIDTVLKSNHSSKLLCHISFQSVLHSEIDQELTMKKYFFNKDMTTISVILMYKIIFICSKIDMILYSHPACSKLVWVK